MTRILLVDWLGRGGIAHTTGAWSTALTAAGDEVMIATRPGRELDALGATIAPVAPSRGTRFGEHAAVVRAAVRAVADWRPDLVVVQNFVLAPIERPVARACARIGAGLVYVIHDHRLHSPLGGTRAGLRSSLRAADEIWTHTEFVGRAVSAYAHRPTRVVPHPVPPQLLAAPAPPRVEGARPVLTAAHFGVLKRGYKGTDLILELARAGVPGWRFHLLGVGAPRGAPSVESTPGFVAAQVLTEAVARSDATLLPYRLASQSGAVVLAQALGSVPVATAVGGIPEQIDDGRDGLLLPSGADVPRWRDALRRLTDDRDAAAAMASAGTRRVWDGHRAFESAVRGLAGTNVRH